MTSNERLFESFFLGGFECSTHRRHTDGKRLDMIAATRHDRFAREDYLRLHEQGIRTAREGLRWHLIETKCGSYDFSSALGIVRAARETKTQIIWDLCHYGYPDWLDIFKPEFIGRLAQFAREFARFLADETDDVPLIAPINEISFFAWGAGEVAYLNPFARKRGDELKAQLVRASIEATEALWSVDPRARIMQIDPLINVIPADPSNPRQRRAAENYRLAQYEAWDMLGGRIHPELGGDEKYLDLLGVNFYAHNQWIYKGSMIPRGHPRYRPLREMLGEIYARYSRPLFIAETGIEDEARPDWLRYVCEETRAAKDAGVDIRGICLYPILNHPGWLDERHCHNGLWDYANERGEREIYQPLADELRRQREIFERESNERDET